MTKVYVIGIRMAVTDYQKTRILESRFHRTGVRYNTVVIIIQ